MENKDIKPQYPKKKIKTELYNDNFQNFKRYNIPKAQLVIADIPYNIGNNFYGSNPVWYKGGDNKNGESKLAKKSAFNTDYNFNIAEYMHFCSKLLKKEPKEKGKAPAMIVFCAFNQMQMVMDYGKKYGFKKSYPIFFIKNYSPQVLKANMKIVGATEQAVILQREDTEREDILVDGTDYAMVLYRDKLPKFNNGKKETGKGKMIFNWFNWQKDGKDIPKIHPTQKPVATLKQLIEIFTDEGDVVIDPCAGSGTTLRACMELNRSSYGFEIVKDFCNRAKSEMLVDTDSQLALLGAD